jgi:ABC-2 type transport system permease protein
MTQKIFFYQVYVNLAEFFRQPMYLISTLIFPSLFFWFFGAPNAKTPESALSLTLSFCAYAVVGVAFYQFLISYSQQRRRTWDQFILKLTSTFSVLLAKSVGALVLSCLAVICVLMISWSSTPIDFSFIEWNRFFISMIIGVFSFSLIAMNVSCLVSPQASVPIANIIYLPLSFAGGLWMPPRLLPQKIQNISEYLPTRWLGELFWSSQSQATYEMKYCFWLFALGALGLVLFVRLSKTVIHR